MNSSCKAEVAFRVGAGHAEPGEGIRTVNKVLSTETNTHWRFLLTEKNGYCKAEVAKRKVNAEVKETNT